MAQRNDIEDVLSSIRRLVAEEAGPAAETKAARALILDPAQRVSEPEDPFQTVQGVSLHPEEDEEVEAAAPNIPKLGRLAPMLLPEPDDDADDDAPEEEAQTDVPDAPEVARDVAEVVPVDLADLSSEVDSDDALRELIVEIVRQELAGALGERITRNVRKLVRRELRQMMSDEEFD